MSQYDNTTVELPVYLMMWPDLCGSAKVVYGALKFRCGSSTSVAISIDSIAYTSGLSKKQTQKHLTTLFNYGLIARKHRYKQTDIYTLLPSPILEGKYPLAPLKGGTKKDKHCTPLKGGEEEAKMIHQFILPGMTPVEMETITLYLAEINRIRADCMTRNHYTPSYLT